MCRLHHTAFLLLDLQPVVMLGKEEASQLQRVVWGLVSPSPSACPEPSPDHPTSPFPGLPWGEAVTAPLTYPEGTAERAWGSQGLSLQEEKRTKQDLGPAAAVMTASSPQAFTVGRDLLGHFTSYSLFELQHKFPKKEVIPFFRRQETGSERLSNSPKSSS